MFDQAIALPDDLDILYVRTDSEKSMTITYADQMIGPVDAVGAFGPLAQMLYAKWPDVFISEAAASQSLALLHFRFMQSGVNNHGIAYPFKQREIQ